jgi:hypothetical protein
VRAGFNRSALVAALAVRELLDLDAGVIHVQARVIRSSSANRTMSSRLRRTFSRDRRHASAKHEEDDHAGH